MPSWHGQGELYLYRKQTFCLAWFHLFCCPIDRPPVNNSSVPLVRTTKILVTKKCSSPHSRHCKIPKILPMSFCHCLHLPQLLASHPEVPIKPSPPPLFTPQQSTPKDQHCSRFPTIQAITLPHSLLPDVYAGPLSNHLSQCDHGPLGSNTRHPANQNSYHQHPPGQIVHQS
jgi:hypothetical protein